MTDIKKTIECLKELEVKATQGPWICQWGDDSYCMNTTYIATKDYGVTAPDPNEVSDDVVAVTLYQAPRIACHKHSRWDEDAQLDRGHAERPA